ncbi:MAG: hypothetical protein K0Q59_1958 [Paenibacillus sp.]|nr:hypothetical protein [Paenibacillus sp.]
MFPLRASIKTMCSRCSLSLHPTNTRWKEFKSKNVSAFIPKQIAPPAYQTQYDSLVRRFLDSSFKEVAGVCY